MPDYPIEELKDRIGESYVTIEGLAIEEGKVEEFARAIKDDNPAHRDAEAAREQGHDRIPAPLTFTRTAYFDRYRPEGIDELRPFDLGFADGRRIHGSQEYEFERPVSVGDELTGEIELTDVYQREGSRGGLMTFAIFEVSYTDQDDDLVLTERMTIIETPGAIDDDGGDGS